MVLTILSICDIVIRSTKISGTKTEKEKSQILNEEMTLDPGAKLPYNLVWQTGTFLYRDRYRL